MKQNIELDIRELVMYGFDHIDRNRVGAALECELTRLLSEQGIGPSLARPADLARVNGGKFNVSGDSKAEAIGAQVAQAVYSGFTK